LTDFDFAALQLLPELTAVLTELGFERPTPIQSQSLPHLLSGKDLIGQSQTGSGKTAAFALPILNKIDLSKNLQALILCPTRELATQVVSEVRKLGRKIEGLKTLSLVGGQPVREQAESLSKGVHIVVGTPGRILDLIERNVIDLSSITTFVLDEADKMLELGFETELKALIKHLPQKRQTVLFSATFPESIELLSRSYQKNPLKVVIDDTSEAKIPDIEQWIYESEPEDKVNTLLRILQQHPAESVLIFCNMKNSVNEIASKLAEQKASSAALHGDLEQRARDKVMTLFRNGSYRILVATDIAARGLDIEDLELVINFDLPQQLEIYVHRIGRTGRAGKKGVSISIATPRDGLRLFEIEKVTRSKFSRQALGFKNQYGLSKDLRFAKMQTLLISGGRKDKLRPGDILGALTNAPNPIDAKYIGKISIQDNESYVAISSNFANAAFEKLRDGKIKGKKFPAKIIK